MILNIKMRRGIKMDFNKKTPLELGKMLCDAIMHKYEPQKLPPEGVAYALTGYS